MLVSAWWPGCQVFWRSGAIIEAATTAATTALTITSGPSEALISPMTLKRIECSCGGQNPSCYRCGGLGHYEGESSEPTGLPPRLRQAGGPDASPHRKIDGHGARHRPAPEIEARAKALFQASAARTAEENEKRRAAGAPTKDGRPSGRGSYLRMRVGTWERLTDDQRQQWFRLAADEASAAARGNRPAPAAAPPNPGSALDPPAPAMNPSSLSMKSGSLYACPVCLRRFRELFPLDSHLLNEHGRLAQAHYWEDRFREAHGIELRPELTEKSEPPKKTPDPKMPRRGSVAAVDPTQGRKVSYFSVGTQAVGAESRRPQEDGGQDGSAGWHAYLQDQGRSGGEFGSYPGFDAMDDESGA